MRDMFLKWPLRPRFRCSEARTQTGTQDESERQKREKGSENKIGKDTSYLLLLECKAKWPRLAV